MWKKLDKWLLFAVMLLLFFGVWMMSWVSVYNSYEKEQFSAARSFCSAQIPNFENLSSSERNACLGSEAAQIEVDLYCSYNNCNDLYFMRHVRNILIGLFGLGVAFLFPVKFWRATAPLWFIGGFILLIIVLILPAQGEFTAKSWLPVPVLGLFQPSEAMKLALALYAALWMEKKKNEVNTLSSGFVPYVLLVGMVVFPVILQPDFGSTIILILIASSMFWMAGGHLLHFVYTGGIMSFIGFTAYSSFDYIKRRFDTFLNPELANAEDRYQIEQAYLSIGNGGWFGAKDSTESFGFLPEIQGDMIFAAIGEKVGYFGMILVLGLYIFITLRGLRIASRAPDRFAMLVAVGITAWFASQSLINMMVVTGLFPLTGITLPLLSYGGTSMLITLSGIGILLKISILSHETEKTNIARRRRKRRTYLPTSGYRRLSRR